MDILTKRIQSCRQNKPGTYKHEKAYWEELTETLNNIGPPYRTLQQWKKVWSDFRRCENKRKFKSITETEQKQNIQKKPKYDKARDLSDEEEEEESDEYHQEIATSKDAKSRKTTQSEDHEHDTQTMKPTFSNECDNEYSYPDEHSSYAEQKALQNILVVLDEPDESSCGSISYAPPELKQRTDQISVNQPDGIKNDATPPPLQPSSARLMDQTLYTLQNQMEHQNKVLEHLSDMSSTMTGLMDRQVNAVEKQTEAIRRQAAATEHHTLVMNNFMDMIREKILKGNSQKSTYF